MKGTTPLTPLADNFKERLQAVEPDLADYVYVGGDVRRGGDQSRSRRSWPGTTKPRQIAKYINGVTTGGELLRLRLSPAWRWRAPGEDLQYRGVSLRRGGFTDAGEPAAASYATLHFDDSRPARRRQDRVRRRRRRGRHHDPTRDRHRARARAPATDDAAPQDRRPAAQTGDLAFTLPADGAPAHCLAIKEINAAGGVFEKPVEWLDGDDGTNPAVAKQTVASHVAAGRARDHRRRRVRHHPGRPAGRGRGRPDPLLARATRRRSSPTPRTRACTSVPPPPTCCRARRSRT